MGELALATSDQLIDELAKRYEKYLFVGHATAPKDPDSTITTFRRSSVVDAMGLSQVARMHCQHYWFDMRVGCDEEGNETDDGDDE